MEFEFTPTPAREPTEEEWALAVETAQEAHDLLQAAVLIGRAAMWKMAEACWRLNELHGWMKLGYDTKGEYLAQPEINLTRETFDRFVRVWQRTVVMRELDASTLKHLDVTKVDIVLPAVSRARVPIDEALADAEVLGAHDLRDKYQGIPSPADPPLSVNGGGGDDADMTSVIAADEQIEAIEQARDEMVEARDSGGAYPRVPHNATVWAVVALEQLIERENGDGEK